MKLFNVVIVSLLLTIVAVPALGHTPNPNGSCDNVGDETATLDVEGVGTVPLAAGVDGVGTVYVTGLDDTPSVWTESNGVAGLQTHDHTCRVVDTGTITSVGPDTQLV